MYLKPLLIGMILFTSLMGLAQQEPAFRNEYYDRLRAEHEDQDTPENAIVFLGNSLTERGSWETYFPEHQIVNRGIGGDIFAGIIDRLGKILQDKPAAIFIMAGANDILFHNVSDADFLSQYTQLIDRIEEQSPQSQVILQSVLPVNETTNPENTFLREKNARILACNDVLKQLARHRNLPYIDIHAQTTENGQLSPQFTTDGVHLSSLGYQQWRTALTSTIDTLKPE